MNSTPETNEQKLEGIKFVLPEINAEITASETVYRMHIVYENKIEVRNIEHKP